MAPTIILHDYREDDAFARGVSILTNMKNAWQAEIVRVFADNKPDGDTGQEINITDHNTVAISQADIFLQSWFAEPFDTYWGLDNPGQV